MGLINGHYPTNFYSLLYKDSEVNIKEEVGYIIRYIRIREVDN
jgi:hypothetical protein